MSIHEIRVSQGEGFDDPRGEQVRHEAAQIAQDPGDVTTHDVYYLEGVTDDEAQRMGQILSDPLTQAVSITPPFEMGDEPIKELDDGFVVKLGDNLYMAAIDIPDESIIEVAPLPGVMNPAVDPILEAAQTIGITPIGVQTGVEYRFQNHVPKTTVRSIMNRLLVNPTIEEVRTSSPITLEVKGSPEPVQTITLKGLGSEELVTLSQERKLALNQQEMRAIQKEAERLGRDLTDVELEYLAAAWSEHCGHKTFNAEIIGPDGEKQAPLFTRIKEGSRPFFDDREVLSAFHDNSGVWRFYDGTALCIKLETHNSPMNLEPYGGSATGTGGVLRDIVATGKGAKVINSQHMQFLAPLDYTQADVPDGCHTPRYLISRSVAGVRDYGNRMGVPTNDVSFHTHPNYRGKGSILVGAMGIMPEANAEKGVPKHGDLVIAAGGKTGRDGLHGATFSSESADTNTSNLHSGAVQIGNAIEEKKVFDAINEASQLGLIKAMTDCGAAGFASAVGEMGEDIGVTIDLDKAPLKYEGLSPWEIFLSESQERMVLAIDPENYDEIIRIFDKHDSNAVALGTFGSPKGEEPSLHVMYQGETVAHLSYDFIKNGPPSQPLEAVWTPLDVPERVPQRRDLSEVLAQVLANGNVCSTAPIVRQYDHEVQGTNALKPYGGVDGSGRNEAVVMTPVLGEPYAVVEAHGCNPTLTELDPRRGSIWAYVEAMSNFVAAGGNPDDAVAVNNFISATPTPRVMGALSESVDALMECVQEFRSPIISGKDSLSSTFKFPDGEILESPYNLIITIAGKIPNVEKTTSSDIKKPGSTLVLIGQQDLEAMGGSVYYEETGGSSARVPEIDLKTFHKTATTLHQAIQTGEVLSAHDVSEGGLATTISEMVFGGNCGATINIETAASRENTLFNETAGCFVVEVENEETAEQLFGDIPHQVIGKTHSHRLLAVHHIDTSTRELSSRIMSTQTLKNAWQRPFEEIF
jgi:phosphoribosylformylglycinamidine synthase II